MRHPNPISRTVKNYIPASSARFNRNERNPKRNSDDEKSNFVRFFESLENRGPLEMHGLYKKWTKRIRREMEEAGTWPKGSDGANHETVAEYISRLQRAFWREFPRFKWHKTDLYEIWSHDEKKFAQFKPGLRTLRCIYNKLHRKGLRDRTYKLSPWRTLETSRIAYIFPGPWGWANDWKAFSIKPFTPWNNHGLDI